MTTRDDRSAQLEKERQGDYGDPLTCHKAIGDAWRAIYQQRVAAKADDLFAPATVALMLAAVKLVRAAYSGKKDTYDDAHVYLEFAERFGRPATPVYAGGQIVETEDPMSIRPPVPVDEWDIPTKPRKERVTAKETGIDDLRLCLSHSGSGNDDLRCTFIQGHLGTHYDVITGQYWAEDGWRSLKGRQ